MSRSLLIELHDRLTGEKRLERHELPVDIGKEPPSGHGIVLDAKYKTISRHHGTLSDENGRLIYRDCSSNGTLIGDTRLKGGRREVSSRDIIRIENYNLRIAEQKVVLIRQTLLDLHEIGESRMSQETSLVLRMTDHGPRLFAPEDQKPGQSEDLQAPDEAETADAPDDRALADFALDDGKLIIRVHNQTLVETFRINGADVHVNDASASLFDVVELAGQRFEYLEPGHHKIVCGNPSCHLLNDPPFTQNCKWCGHDLVASGSISRLVG
ncbi:MAG: FHA domain-containing protein [Pseudomonadota bacterium]